MVKLKLATWNVITVDLIKRRNGIFKELEEKKIDVACLQETKLLDHEFIDVNHIIFKPGKAKGKCPHGVGFACKRKLIDCFSDPLYVEPNRLIVIKFKKDDETIYIINVYAPTNSKETKPEDKDNFYSCLECAFSIIPPSETVFIIGDFNAQVGDDNVAWPTCLGPYGVGEINDNGQRLLEFCSLHDLCVLNTYTKLQESEQYTHQNPRWKTWSQLDLCITRVRDRHKVIITLPVANLIDDFDHKMVIFLIDTKSIRSNTESISQHIETKATLFRYLLKSVYCVMKTKKSSLEFKRNNDLMNISVSEEIFKKSSKCIEILKEFINKNETYFYNKNCIPEDEVINDFSNTIIQVSRIFLNERIEIEEKDFEILFDRVKIYLTENEEVTLYGASDILKGKLSNIEKKEIKEITQECSKTNKLGQNNEQNLETETVKSCEDFVLPRELLYVFICQQCMNIANLPSIIQRKDFCTNLRQVLSECMLARLKSLLTDEMLQQPYIFKCTVERDMLFALNLLQEKCLKKVVPFYIAFVDLSQILGSRKTPISVKCLIDESQWALYLPLLFSEASGQGTQNEIELMTFLLSYILNNSIDKHDGILKIKYSCDGTLFNKTRLDTNAAKKFNLRVIQFKSYAAIFSTTINDIQACIEKIEKACNSIGLSFVQNEPLIVEQNVKEVSRELRIGSETVILSKNVNFLGVNFTSKQFSLKTDIFFRIHNACKRLQTEPTISYEAISDDLMRNLEILSLINEDEEALDKFNERCLKRFQVSPETKGISRRIRSARMDLLGTYHRDKLDNIAKRILYGDLDVERQKNISYLSNLKRDLKSLNYEQSQWQECAEDEERWKSKIETII